MSSNQPEEDKETSFKRGRLSIALFLLRPRFSQLSSTLGALPRRHSSFRNASRRDVVEFLDEYFNRTEIPWSDDEASIHRQYDEVMEIMWEMDDNIRLLDLVYQASPSSTIRRDISQAVEWWRQALLLMSEVDQDPWSH
ncbi:unnamed protein product [Clonostachys solani]|uniref:Uncharacterized protein n=1 Tax=Clonostachys solani TaxID=160281 RepID=A0A9N9YYS3_9HYPO|nr:unnamed protein product [Clonostachys solani]